MLVCQAPALFHLPFETQGWEVTNRPSQYGEDDIAVQLMFYSTLEVLDLPGWKLVAL